MSKKKNNMKIKVINNSGGADNMSDSINESLSDIINQGFMIIDYGIESKGGKDTNGVYGYIKYCDKSFLRDYKIKSIMNEL